MKTCQIEGGKLRVVLLERGMAQRELAEKIGVTHFNVSRWCRRGAQSVKTANMNLVAKALDLSLEVLMARCGVGRDTSVKSGLSDAERDWLKVYQTLSPLDQAKARIAVEDFVSKKKA